MTPSYFRAVRCPRCRYCAAMVPAKPRSNRPLHSFTHCRCPRCNVMIGLVPKPTPRLTPPDYWRKVHCTECGSFAGIIQDGSYPTPSNECCKRRLDRIHEHRLRSWAERKHLQLVSR